MADAKRVIKEGWGGRFYGDFEIGDVYQSPYGRTVTELDNSTFTHLTLNTNPATGGDVARYVAPYTGEKDSVYFQSFNRNKKSMTLNLQSEKGQEILHKLVAVSDCVFV
jgi:hypothetical protein